MIDNQNNIFSYVKQSVTYDDINRLMGWPSKQRNGKVWVKSPFNPLDKNPSMCEYIGSGWKDFSTGRGGGDEISLYATVNGLSQYDAAQQLAEIFNLNYTTITVCHKSTNDCMPDFLKGVECWSKVVFAELCNILHILDAILKTYNPETVDLLFYDLVALRGDLDLWTDILFTNQLLDVFVLYKKLRYWGLSDEIC